MEAETVAVLPSKPVFKALKPQEIPDAGGVQFRKVPVPPHRLKPLKRDWEEIYNLVYDQMKVDIRMNTKARQVELKTRPDTPEIGDLQKCADFIHAFMLGFGFEEAKDLLRCNELYVDSFEIKDVKTLRGETVWKIWKNQVCDSEYYGNKDCYCRHEDSHFGALFSHQDCEEMSLRSHTGVSDC
ncbi:hypothetical protein ACS0TY_015764 [Phlomoides rotata]